MISASHNPAPDNGLKLFAAGGAKLTDAQEDAIEAHVSPSRRCGRSRGRDRGRRIVGDYVEHLLATVGSLAGLHVVVDGAQGAASNVAPEVYRRAGATVTAIHCDGDGTHINEGCGATHPESLAAAVVEHGADVGIAHDGDADRCIVVDGAGRVLSGDQVLGSARAGPQGRRAARQRRPRRHRDEQPRSRAGHGGGGHRRRTDRRRRPLRPRGDAGRRPPARRRAERPRRHARPRDHRRRPADGAARHGPRRPHRPRWPTSPRR